MIIVDVLIAKEVTQEADLTRQTLHKTIGMVNLGDVFLLSDMLGKLIRTRAPLLPGSLVSLGLFWLFSML